MFETTLQFKPRAQWRTGMTPDKLVEELDRAVGAGLSIIAAPTVGGMVTALLLSMPVPDEDSLEWNQHSGVLLASPRGFEPL